MKLFVDFVKLWIQNWEDQTDNLRSKILVGQIKKEIP